LKLRWLDKRQNTADRIMSRDAVLKRDKLSAPRQLSVGKLRDVGGPIAAGDCSSTLMNRMSIN